MTTSSRTRVRPVRRRHLSGWRRRAAALAAPPVLLVVAAGPAHADPSDALRVAAQLGPGHGAGAVALRLLLLVGMVLAAGSGLAAVGVRGALPRALPVLAWTAAIVVAAGAEAAYLTGESTMTGTLVQALVALAVPVLLTTRLVAVAVVLLTALLALGLGSAHSGFAAVLDATYAVAAVVLVGASLWGLLTGRAAGPVAARGHALASDGPRRRTGSVTPSAAPVGADASAGACSGAARPPAAVARSGSGAVDRPAAAFARRGSGAADQPAAGVGGAAHGAGGGRAGGAPAGDGPAGDRRAGAGGTVAIGHEPVAGARARAVAARRDGVAGPRRGIAAAARPSAAPGVRSRASAPRGGATVLDAPPARRSPGVAADTPAPLDVAVPGDVARRAPVREPAAGSAAAVDAPRTRHAARRELAGASPAQRRRSTGRRAAVAGPDDGGRTAPLVRRVAIAAGVVATVAALVQLVLTGPATTADLVATPYGLASLGATVLPAAATGLWVLVGLRPGRDRAVELQRFAVVTAVLGVVATAALAGLPTPAPAATPGTPLLRAVALGATPLAVLVAPMRPGPNLVQVSGTGYPDAGTGPGVAAPAEPVGHQHADLSGPAGLTVDAGGGPVAFTSRPGAPGGWAVVDIPAGTRELALRSGPLDVVVPVDVGDAGVAAPTSALGGPDGPECASALLGGFVARRTGATDVPMPACPSDALAPGDATSLSAMTNFVGEHGVGALRLVSDDSPRSRAAAAVVRDEAARHHLRLVDAPGTDVALVVVSGWEQAVSALQEATRLAGEAPTYLGGTFLAPWLLTPSVVTKAQSSVLALEFTPQDAGPQQYAATLAATFPGAAPSASGYLAWVDATRSTLDARPRLYGAAPVDVPMSGDDDMAGMHGVNPAAWFPGGTVVPVTGPLAGT
ncbi:hypothetical protein [Pseudonocardia sp. D17]|uniref:hypothetical protein n=1 Tax=Pseudonocardia sp. D17 TaxID=882661 RepID=UPI0030D375E7